MRQVPDHQEVFQTVSSGSPNHNDNNDARGSCYIVELLDLDKNISDDESCSTYYFTDLSEANNAVSINITNKYDSQSNADLLQQIMCNLKLSNSNVFIGMCNGWQDMTCDTNQEAQQRIWIELCVIRLKDVSTDLLITWTIPILDSAASTDQYNVSFMKILSTLRVNDWSLFA